MIRFELRSPSGRHRLLRFADPLYTAGRMTTNIILVGIGGMLGSMLRYAAGQFITAAIPSAFPYGTIAVNILGCLTIGIVFGLSQRCEWLSSELRVFLTVGFCGGFTTFSAFAYENIILLQDKDYLTFALYSILSFMLCLSATLVGLVIAKG